jgi:large subunit ribosomal protein L10
MARTQMAIVADYRGLSVADMAELRQKLREHGAELVVAKNTLLRLAARDTGLENLEAYLEGPTAVTFAYDDPSKVAKVLVDYAKVPNTPFTVRGGVFGGQPLPAEGLEQITKLPTREEVLSQVLGGLTAPVSQFVGLLDQPAVGLVGVLDATVSSLVYALQARADQLQSQSA